MAKANKEDILYREASFDVEGINKESREISLAFSSEQPVMRYDWANETRYMEVLDHAPENADLSRLNNSGAFLVNHDTDDQVGAVKRNTAKIDADKIGRATVKLSRSNRGEEILNDILDGIRSSVSFGYQTTKELSRSKDAQGMETRRFAFRAYEISTVPIPADTSVGVGRSEPETPKTNLPIQIMSEPITQPSPDSLRAEGRQAEQKRNTEINAIAERLVSKIPTIRELAKSSLDSGHTVDQFRALAMEKLPEAQPVRSAPLEAVTAKDWSKYSISRAIAMSLPGARMDGLEKEISDEMALKSGSKPMGLYMPDEALVARNAIAGTNTLGGFLVETQNLGEQFISILRNRSKVMSLGARVLNLTGPVTIPRQNGASSTNWVGETTASTLSGVDFTQLTLTPKGVTSFLQYGKQLLMESNPSIDGILRDDITQQLALAIDLACIHGTGANSQPTGIAATTGINTVAIATDGLALGNATAYPFLVSLETKIATSNADVQNMAYLMRAGHRGALKTQSRFSSTDTPVFEPNGTVNGYRAEVSQQVATNLTTGTATTICSAIFFGDWNQLLVAQFGATDLVVDPYTLAVNGVVRLIARRWVDLGVRTPASFCVGGGILTN